jgi:hypothetical protein
METQMKDKEKQICSQNGEDGIIEYIFDKIGTTNKIAVEFGVSATDSRSIDAGLQTNTRHLANTGWKTFWFDINEANNIPPGCTFIKEMLTPANISDVFKKQNIPLDLDLLSIDVDGNDWHLREALSEFKPRVCIMEYNGCYDSTSEYIMPHDNGYSWTKRDTTFGASLTSLTNQAKRLGYDLVYCESQGVNAFFIRHDANVFEIKTPEEAWVKLFWAKEIKTL